MKKVSMILCVATIAFALVACGGAKKEDPKTPETTENADVAEDNATEQPSVAMTPEELKVAAEEALKKYEKTVKDYLDILVKFQKGDMSVANQYQKISKELPEVTNEAYKYAAEFDAKQTKRLEAAAKKYADAVKALAK